MGRSELSRVVMILSLAACEKVPAIHETGVEIVLPQRDRDARERLAAIEIELWPIEHQLCKALALWRRDVCGQPTCDTPPLPAGEMPAAGARMTRGEGDVWITEQFDAPGPGPWELVLRGVDVQDNAFVFGCVLVTSQARPRAVLWRPWCDQFACLERFHEACIPIVDCEAAPTPDDPDRLATPICFPAVEEATAWEHRGAPCPLELGGVRVAPCRPAIIACTSTGSFVREDGVCPIEVEEPCGIDPQDDLDCDGDIPGPCGECLLSDPPQSCQIGECVGQSFCEEGEVWGQCQIRAVGDELCDGLDTDCDDLADGDDPDALAACNVGRATNQPAADLCTRRACWCGTDPACGEGSACCSGACVDLSNDSRHCSACNRACPDGARCAGGRCVRVNNMQLQDAGGVIVGPDAEALKIEDSGFSQPDAGRADAPRDAN